MIGIRPPLLAPGDLVALVSPAGVVDPVKAAAMDRVVRSWGLRTRTGRHALGRHTYLSGTDDERLADLNGALRDPEVRGVLCIRGGYGTQRIVDRVDVDAVRADPKLVVGFSDITALHLALWCEAGLATVHGPMGTGLSAGQDSRDVLMTGAPVVVTAAPDRLHRAGRAEGLLLGGNLTMLATSAGTRHRPDTTGAILLLEEVHEAPYRIDRSITQLRRAGWLDGLAGVAVGQFTGCDGRDPAFTAHDVLADHLLPLGVPLLAGLPIGHGTEHAAVPLGVPATLDTGAGTLTVTSVGRAGKSGRTSYA